MSNNWHSTYDVIVVGSGAGALTGAITAGKNGMKTLVTEKMDKWGGSSAYSGGGLWIPNNFLMREAGLLDSEEEALKYMEAVIHDVGPASSRERKEAYVKNAPVMVEMLRDFGFEWVRAEFYPDYYPEKPGGKVGRCIEGEIFNGKKLGKLLKTINGVPSAPNVPVKSANAYLLPLVFQTWKGFTTAMKILGIAIGWTLTGRYPLGIGRSLVGQLMYILQSNYKTPVWLECPMKDIIIQDGRAVGLVIEKEGKLVNVQAQKGILLAAGGFAKGDEYRRKHQPVGADWTSASPGNTGDIHQIGEKIGCAMALMDEAWWGGSYIMDGKVMFSVNDRSFPGTILVDHSGERYVNESTSYVDFGRAILDREAKVGGAIPSWLIISKQHRRKYMFGMMMPGLTPKKYIKDGTIVKADTIEELANKCNINEENLVKTVKRFNSFAKQGLDDDFKRGNDIYDRYYGDPRVLPNANLAPFENGPFYAIRFYPGDLGTKGGLLTDEHARVLREDGSVIEGLYCTGNNSASVMGQTYPGPGSTLGPSCTFGYVAMNHLAEKK